MLNQILKELIRKLAVTMSWLLRPKKPVVHQLRISKAMKQASGSRVGPQPAQDNDAARANWWFLCHGFSNLRSWVGHTMDKRPSKAMKQVGLESIHNTRRTAQDSDAARANDSTTPGFG